MDHLQVEYNITDVVNMSAERNKQTARGTSKQSTNSSDPITSTSELLLRKNSVTTHAHQS
jgi:hypothetical protein